MTEQIDFSTPLTNEELDAMLDVASIIETIPTLPSVGPGFVETDQLSEEAYWGVYED